MNSSKPINRDVDKIGAEVPDRQGLGHSDDEPSGNGAPDIAHAADHHGGDALEAERFTHERMHLPVVEREQHAGKRREQPADDEHQTARYG